MLLTEIIDQRLDVLDRPLSPDLHLAAAALDRNRTLVQPILQEVVLQTVRRRRFRDRRYVTAK